jgi:hypothetical protein
MKTKLSLDLFWHEYLHSELWVERLLLMGPKGLQTGSHSLLLLSQCDSIRDILLWHVD